MVRKSMLFIMLLVIIGGLLSMACDPPDPASCSQGFWKNKGYKIFGSQYPADALEALSARGYGSEAIRDEMTAYLNWKFWQADDFCLD